MSVFNQKTGEFEFRPGPIFANIVLADEINRASPKTQSSLLECMEERQATIDNVTHPIAAPFMVIATQNPIEYEGTYPLPEAQLDRFMMRLSLGYPSPAKPRRRSSTRRRRATRSPSSSRSSTAAEVLAMQAAVTRVKVAPALRRYVVDLLTATRAQRDIYLGASPRAGIALVRAAKALALLRGRDFVVPQDVKDLAAARARPPHHALARRQGARAARKRRSIARLLETVPVPGHERASPHRPRLALLGLVAGTYLAARVVGTWELYLFSFAFLAALLVSWLLVLPAGGSSRPAAA